MGVDTVYANDVSDKYKVKEKISLLKTINKNNCHILFQASILRQEDDLNEVVYAENVHI